MKKLIYLTQDNKIISDLMNKDCLYQFDNFIDAEHHSKKNNALIHLIYVIEENKDFNEKNFYCYGVAK